MADRKLSELSQLTTPRTNDQFLVLDASVSNDANKNKRVRFGALCDHIPDGSVTAPSLCFFSDTGDSGFFRSAEDEIAISTSDSLNSKFTTTGFQVGNGTATGKFHTFNNTSQDDVVIENTRSGANDRPVIVFYRNSSTPADDDTLATIEFRGNNDNDQEEAYAEITAGIVDASDSSEDGRLDFQTSVAGSSFNCVRLQEGRVGINEAAPEAPIHVNNTDTQILRLECPNNDASSGADIRMYRHRNDAVGQDDDALSTIFFRGHNDNADAAQRQVDYAQIQAAIGDASSGTEQGKLLFQVQHAGTMSTQFEIHRGRVGFFGTAAASQATAVADLAASANNGTLPTANGTMTFADAASPTNAELLEYCRELEAKVNSLLAFAKRHGLMASS